MPKLKKCNSILVIPRSLCKHSGALKNNDDGRDFLVHMFLRNWEHKKQGLYLDLLFIGTSHVGSSEYFYKLGSK